MVATEMKGLLHSSGPTSTRDAPTQELVEQGQHMASTQMAEPEDRDIPETEVKLSIRIAIELALKSCLNFKKIKSNYRL